MSVFRLIMAIALGLIMKQDFISYPLDIKELLLLGLI